MIDLIEKYLEEKGFEFVEVQQVYIPNSSYTLAEIDDKLYRIERDTITEVDMDFVHYVKSCNEGTELIKNPELTYFIAENTTHIALFVNGQVSQVRNISKLTGDSHKSNVIGEWKHQMKVFGFKETEPSKDWFSEIPKTYFLI